jgi:hypothetical protein
VKERVSMGFFDKYNAVTEACTDSGETPFEVAIPANGQVRVTDVPEVPGAARVPHVVQRDSTIPTDEEISVPPAGSSSDTVLEP